MFATGRISCTAAMKIGNTLLTRYRAARERSGGAIKPALKGFDVCGTKPGQASCHDLRDASNITLFETGTCSLAQVKQFVAAGKLRSGSAERRLLGALGALSVAGCEISARSAACASYRARLSQDRLPVARGAPPSSRRSSPGT